MIHTTPHLIYSKLFQQHAQIWHGLLFFNFSFLQRRRPALAAEAEQEAPPLVDERVAGDQHVRPRYRVGGAGLLAALDEVVDQHPQPAPGTRAEFGDDTGQVIDATELLDDDAFDLMIIENMQRDDLTPLETAQAFAAFLSSPEARAIFVNAGYAVP